MENISNFLRACQIPPLSLPPHDVFLTVDLYERKDPLQVLQCISAFSRSANILQPSRFRRTLGAKANIGSLSSHSTGSSQGDGAAKLPVSTWSKPSDEVKTMPAWNIHQYGYMGGATQGNQGVAFGVPRQITSAAPKVPSLVEKEKRRKEEAEKQRLGAEEAERARQVERQRERQADEERAQIEEEERWNDETARMREQERRDMAEESNRWAEEQRKWEEEEQRQVAEERDAEERKEQERHQRRSANDARLNGQFLSQYRASQQTVPTPVSRRASPVESKEKQRIRELEKELDEAKQREHQYETQRQEINEKREKENRSKSPNGPRPLPAKPSYNLSSLEQERRLLRTEWQNHQNEGETTSPQAEPAPQHKGFRPLLSNSSNTSNAVPSSPPETPRPSRPLPEPTPTATAAAPRPLPDPLAANKGRENRVERFLSSHPAPKVEKPTTYRPQDYSTTAEVDAENERRIASQQKTRAGGWASKTLLEREMEAERIRQQEWEENQKEVKAAASRGRKDSVGTGPGEGAWDVHQYGYLGGDNQNRGGQGIGFGMRRQIVGPKPKGM